MEVVDIVRYFILKDSAGLGLLDILALDAPDRGFWLFLLWLLLLLAKHFAVAFVGVVHRLKQPVVPFLLSLECLVLLVGQLLLMLTQFRVLLSLLVQQHRLLDWQGKNALELAEVAELEFFMCLLERLNCVLLLLVPLLER